MSEGFDEKGTVSGELRETECVISEVSDNRGMDKKMWFMYVMEYWWWWFSR